uniref:Uncharacterized protein n=1 Tax=Anguilla anguilla TaxID=7936 RepID=A0A0E9SLY9_ANGAN
MHWLKIAIKRQCYFIPRV